MTTLTPLDPVPAVSCAQVDILAPDAGRTDAGLVGTVQICNGRVLVSRLLHHADPEDRRLLATEGAAASGVAVEVLLAGILDLGQVTDVALRRTATPAVWDGPPVPLATTPVLPAFPVEALPVWLREFAREESHATQTPIDLSAMLELGAVAASVAGKAEVSPRPGWAEPLGLFIGVFLPSGERKTAVYNDVTRPVARWERDQAAELAPSITKAVTEYRITEKRLAAVENKAANAPASEVGELTREAADLRETLAALHVPVVPRCIAEDLTPEKLAGLLAEHGGRMAVFSDEGGPLDAMAGRYSTSPNLDVYLKGHAGSDIRVDRVHRPPEHIERPALTLAVSPQPDVLSSLRDVPGAAGRGLLARFLYSVPASRVGRRVIDPPSLSDATRHAFEAGLTCLLNLPTRAAGEPPPLLHMTPEARTVLLEFAGEIEPQLGPDGELAGLAGWGNKLVGAVARLAGLVHIATTKSLVDRQITAETVRHAISIGRYLIPHAQAAFGQMVSDPALEEARQVLGWIHRHGHASFSRRDAYRSLRKSFKRPDALDAPLALLAAHGYIRERPAAAGGGRKPTRVYDVHPAVLTDANEPTLADLSPLSPESPSRGHSAKEWEAAL